MWRYPLAIRPRRRTSQVVAFGTHSSMASLPATSEGAQSTLGLSQTATGFVLPLSLAVFKYLVDPGSSSSRFQPLYGQPIDSGRMWASWSPPS